MSSKLLRVRFKTLFGRVDHICRRVRDVGDKLNLRDRINPPPNTKLRRELDLVSEGVSKIDRRGASHLGIGPGNFTFERMKGYLYLYFIPAARSPAANKKFFEDSERDVDKLDKTLNRVEAQIEAEMRP